MDPNDRLRRTPKTKINTVTAQTTSPPRLRIGRFGLYTPSKVAWALGTFGFVLSAIFLTRIYYVYRYRQSAEVISEETHRVGVLLDRHITGLIKDVDDWIVKRPRDAKFYKYPSPPPVLGVRAVRVYKLTGLVAEWTDAATQGQKFGIENILIREANTRLASLGGELVALSWVSRDQSKVMMVFDRANFNLTFAVTPELAGRVSMVVVNSMEQVLLQTSREIQFEVFRENMAYKYDGRGTIEVRDLGKDIMAYLSIPSTQGLVLIGRLAR